MSETATTQRIAGIEPVATHAPNTLEELRELVRRDDGTTLVPVGGGTMLSLGGAPARPFATVDHRQALSGPLEHAPDQIASRPLWTRKVTDVPTAKLADPVLPVVTLIPVGVETTRSPLRPPAVTVRVAVCGGGGGGAAAVTVSVATRVTPR